jgi:putative heme-binding domain-containing protein
VLQSAAKYSDAAIPTAILGGYEAKIAGDLQVRETALRALCGRLEWALKLVDALDQWQVPAKHITPEMIGVLRQHADPKITAALESRWKGVLTSASMEEKAVESKRIRGALRGGAGDVSKGQAIFQARCAACHKLFGEGNVVGPELTGYERGNPDFWLDNLLYPSLEIREGFGNYTARLKNGQILTGMLESQGASGIVLRDLAGQKTRVAQAEIQTLEASPISIMPEGLLGGLSDAELRDLMSHLMRPEQAQSR